MLQREYICQALERLSELLLPAVVRAEESLGVKMADAFFLGLSIEATDAERGLRQRKRSLITQNGLLHWRDSVLTEPLFSWLKYVDKRFNETDFGLFLLALAAEFNSGYERFFGFLQDDVTRRRASVELAEMLFEDASPDANVMGRLNPSNPLLSNRLIELVDPPDGRTGLRAQVIRLNEQFARWTFGMSGLDRRLSAVAQLIEASTSDVPYDREVLRRISQLRPLQLHLSGPDIRLNFSTLEVLATLLGQRLLVVDAGRFTAVEGQISELSRLLVHETKLFGHLLVFSGVDAMHTPEKLRGWDQLCSVLSGHRDVPFALLCTRSTLPPTSYPLSVMRFEIARPDVDKRFEYWNRLLTQHNLELTGMEVQLLADRYTLTYSQIRMALVEAMTHARLREAQTREPGKVTFAELSVTARQQGGQDLESLTTRITPRVLLDDVVVPQDVRTQLQELSSRVRNRNWVLGNWGFGRRQSYGLGVNALFAGPTGTGKTMAAEAIAHVLGKDLYKIDLTSVVSKYIGETEQKLEEVFQAGEATQAVLFFDEADSLLGKRSEVKDAHDRYANLEVSYLLQRMERYDGLIILATNLLGNLDEAFLRRMATIVHFSKPAFAERRLLWQKAWPRDGHGRFTFPMETRSGFAVDFDFLAERFELTGGNIRNAVVAAAFSAADRPHFSFVTMWDVLQGVRREFQKLGQVMTDDELGFPLFSDPTKSGNPAKQESLENTHGRQAEVSVAQ